MPQFTLYPRLYTTRRERGEDVLVSTGDATVVALYEFFTNRTVDLTTWQFRKQVLESAVRLFGNIGQWLTDQDHNPRVVGYNLEFLKDTFNFIRGQERQMRLQTWIELLDEMQGDTHPVSHANNAASKIVLLNDERKTAELLAKWCARPGGIEDLLGTLHILFGRARHQTT